MVSTTPFGKKEHNDKQTDGSLGYRFHYEGAARLAGHKTFLQLLQILFALLLPHSAYILDVGGGDSKLVDYLIEERFERITVLDISQAAFDRAMVRF